MSRRQFLQVTAAAAALGAIAGSALPDSDFVGSARKEGVRPRLRAICFDLFTLFDPRSVVRVAESIIGARAAELCEAWRLRLFEYSWIRASAQKYADFETVTRESLAYAADAKNVTLSADARQKLVAACSELEPWPDARVRLGTWKAAGLKLAPLSNYTPGMLAHLITRAGLGGVFDMLISTDASRTFKPDPRAYALGPTLLGLSRQQIAFAAFGGWDAAGATWFGFPTFWVNRLGTTAETLTPPPDGTGPTLAELAAFVSRRGAP